VGALATEHSVVTVAGIEPGVVVVDVEDSLHDVGVICSTGLPGVLGVAGPPQDQGCRIPDGYS